MRWLNWSEQGHGSSAHETYIRTYGSVIRDVFSVGGFPAVLAGMSALISLLAIVANAEASFGWLLGFAALALIASSVLYVYETSWKRRMLQRALDRFDEISRIVLTRYLESRETVDVETVRNAIELINSITHADRKAIVTEIAPPDET